MKKKGVKERLKRISLYGLDIKEAIRAFMRVDPGELKEHQRHFSGCFCPGDGHVRHWQVWGPAADTMVLIVMSLVLIIKPIEV